MTETKESPEELIARLHRVEFPLCLDAANCIVKLERQNTQLTLLLQGKIEASFRLLHAEGARGQFTLWLASEFMPVLAGCLDRWFDDIGGINCVELQVKSEEHGPMLLTLQREDGKTPMCLLVEEREKVQVLEEGIDARLAALEKAHRADLQHVLELIQFLTQLQQRQAPPEHPVVTSDGYYLLSIKHSRADHMVWWRPDEKDYTNFLDSAGVYSAEHIRRGRLKYHIEQGHIIAIPATEIRQYQKHVLPVETREGFVAEQLLDKYRGVVPAVCPDPLVSQKAVNEAMQQAFSARREPVCAEPAFVHPEPVDPFYVIQEAKDAALKAAKTFLKHTVACDVASYTEYIILREKVRALETLQYDLDMKRGKG